MLLFSRGYAGYFKCLSYGKMCTYTRVAFHMDEEVNDMPYYRQDARMGGFPQNGQGQYFGSQVPQAYRQQMGVPRFNEFSQPYNAFYPPYPIDPRLGQQYNPRWQGQKSRFDSLSDNLNKMAGHMGTITNGINAMKQVSAMIKLFR